MSTTRANQLEAAELDGEVHSLFSRQLSESLKYVPSVYKRFGAELDLLLRGGVFVLSVATHNASFGAIMENLQWRAVEQQRDTEGRSKTRLVVPSRRKKALMALLFVFAPYFWRKISHLCHTAKQTSDDEKQNRRLDQLWTVLQRLESVYNLFYLLNFLLFLKNGRYSTLFARLLGVRLVHTRRGVARNASFGFMNRELVWQNLTDFALFVAPLVDFHALQRRLSRWTRQAAAAVLHGSAHATSAAGSGSARRAAALRERGQLNDVLCCLCDETMLGTYTDVQLACSHTACYWCMSNERHAGGGAACGVCGQHVVLKSTRNSPEIYSAVQ